MRIGGYSWDAPGHIWYESLKASSAQTQFQEFADSTYWKAGQLHGAGSTEQQAVLAAWNEVGVRISGVEVRRERVRAGNGHSKAQNGATIPALIPQIEALAAQVNALAEDVRVLTPKP